MVTDTLIEQIEAQREEFERIGSYADITFKIRADIIDIHITKRIRRDFLPGAIEMNFREPLAMPEEPGDTVA